MQNAPCGTVKEIFSVEILKISFIYAFEDNIFEKPRPSYIYANIQSAIVLFIFKRVTGFSKISSIKNFRLYCTYCMYISPVFSCCMGLLLCDSIYMFETPL